VAFRGTVPTNLSDWLRDLDCFPKTNDHMGIFHQGFLNGAMAGLGGTLRALGGRGATLVGHSLGGALAALTAALLRVQDLPVARLVTFGCPRAVLWWHNDVLKDVPGNRFVRILDPVPDVPGLFKHYTPLETRLLDDLQQSPIANHSMTRYVASVAAWEKNHA
jgi:pimeloyl-ACP methyl ester carboxylesterase